ncbi:DoxX family membrane protein [Bacillus thuringiensis]|nr:DoxX family membrane protein [Bacillus thuringiensis]
MKRIYMKIEILLVILASLSPCWAYAHVKWFTKVAPERASMAEILNPLFIITVMLIVSLLLILPIIIKNMENWNWSQRVEANLKSFSNYSRCILIYGTAFALVFQLLSGYILAPEFHVSSNLLIGLVWGIVLLLVIPNHIGTRIGGLGVILLYIGITLQYGFFNTLDYIFYIGIALTLFFKNKKYSIMMLYFTTGFSLCWVAMEKIVYPSMAIDIIIGHDVPHFGFSPEVFVLLCAFIEFIIGYLLCMGILNRTLAAVITMIFISTTLIFGIKEIIGHFMLHVVFIVFIIEGSKDYPMRATRFL